MKHFFCHFISCCINLWLLTFSQRSPGNPKSDSLWSDTWTQTFLPINYISCVIKQKLAFESWNMFQAPLGHVLFVGSHTSWLWGSLCPCSLGKRNLGFTLRTEQMLECFFPVHSLSTMCHSLPPKHLIYSNSLAWPNPLSLPPDPSVFHFPLASRSES